MIVTARAQFSGSRQTLVASAVNRYGPSMPTTRDVILVNCWSFGTVVRLGRIDGERLHGSTEQVQVWIGGHVQQATGIGSLEARWLPHDGAGLPWLRPGCTEHKHQQQC